MNFVKLVQESGPSHAKKFVTRCSVDTKKEESTPFSLQTQTNLLKLPPNAPTYFETIGEGNSKKVSKLNAAIAMLKIIKENFEPIILMHLPTHRTAGQKVLKKKLPEPSRSTEGTTSTVANNTIPSAKEKKRNKTSNIDKIKKTTPEYGKGTINAISRLTQIQQARREPEPLFEFVSSSTTNVKYRRPISGGVATTGTSSDGFFTNRRHEFVFQCIVKKRQTQVNNAESGDSTSSSSENWEVIKSEGKASTKKNAKKNAAEAMLMKLGYQPLPPTPVLKPALKTSSASTPSATNKPVSILQRSEETEKEGQKETSANQEEQFRAEASSSPSSSEGKSEKHVKFAEAVLIDDSGEEKSNPRRVVKQQKATNVNANEHQRINLYKEKLNEMIKTRETVEEAVFGQKDLENTFKIAGELLASMEKKPSENETLGLGLNEVEFRSETAERILEDQRKNLSEQDQKAAALQFELNNNCDKDSDVSSRLLIGNTANYKKALDYLANVIRFKVIYQSLLSVSF